MNALFFKNYLIILLFGLPFLATAQHFYLGLGYSSVDPKSTLQARYYREGYNPGLEFEYAINAQYEKKFGKDLGLSLYVGYVHNTNKNVFWINSKYFPQIDPRKTVLRYSFNNSSHLFSAGASVNLDLVKIKNSSWGVAPFFRTNFLFKKQTQPVDFDDFKFATHKVKPFSMEAYPFLFCRIDRFLIQLGARIYSLKYFDDVVDLNYTDPNPKMDYINPFKLMANIAYRL